MSVRADRRPYVKPSRQYSPRLHRCDELADSGLVPTNLTNEYAEILGTISKYITTKCL